jgi:hypothetical protein
MDASDRNEASTLVLRLVDVSAPGLRVRVVEVGATGWERVLGVVTSPAAAAAIVRGWLEAALEGPDSLRTRPPRPKQGSAG